MFGDLTVGQKLQAAIICVALGVSGYLIFSNTRTHFDDTVNSWPAIHQYPMDPKQRYDKVKNPWNAVKEEKLTVLACADGQVDFIEYPNDPDKHLKVVFRPDTRHAGKTFQYYHDPMLAVADIRDPYRHAMAYAVYIKLYRPEDLTKLPANQRSALGQVQPAITQDQLDKEKEARKVMDNSIKVTEAMVEVGTYHKDILQPMEAALKEFQSNQKDIITDKAKQDLARKLLTMAASYDQCLQEARGEAIDKYTTAMDSVLTDEQKDSLIAIVAKREQKMPTVAPGGRRGATRGGPGGGRAATTAPAGGRGR